MTRTKKTIAIGLLFLLASHCKKESCEKNLNISCDILHHEIVSNVVYDESNVNIIKAEIEKLTKDLTPHPSSTDKLGQLSNLYTLFNRLEKCGNMSFYILCYGCIQTGIPQTEVLVMADSSGVQIQRVFDFMTGDQLKLTFANAHNYSSH